MTPTQETGTFPEIPGFELKERIGEGGLGVVYKALQVSLNRVVAVKVMRQELAADTAFRERFDQEWKTASELKHPNIVQILEAGSHNGLQYFVMEHVGGDSLEGRLQRGETLNEAQALVVAEAVTNALKYALESNGTIHGDLRPGNIMFEPDGMVKVADFFGVPTDKNLYMSPEAESADRHALDFKSDIYSLGAVLYHLLTGRSPHTPKSASGLSGKSASVLDPPDSVNKSLSTNLSLFIEKLLIRVRQVRYGSWADLMVDLQSVLDGSPPARLPPSGASAVRRGGHMPSAEKSRQPSPPPPMKDTNESPSEASAGIPLELAEKDSPPEEKEALASGSLVDSQDTTHETPSGAESNARPGLKIQVRKPPEPELPTQEQEFVTVREKRRSHSGNSLRILVGIGMAAVFIVACWFLWVRVGAKLFAGNDDLETLPDPGFDEPRPDTGQTDIAAPAEEVEPADPVQATVQTEVEPPDEPEGPRFPNEFREYLDAISPAMKQMSRRQYRHGEGTLALWLGKNRDHPYGPHARRQADRIHRVADLVKLLKENQAHVLDARIDQGKVVGIENDKVEVQTVGGGRPSTRAIGVDVLSDRDYLSLLKLAAPEGIFVNSTMYWMSRGEFDKAEQLLHGGNIEEPEYSEMKTWYDEWGGIQADLLAQEAVDEVSRLARRGDFRQAEHKFNIAMEKFSETDTFQWARKKEIEALQTEITEVVSRMNSRRQAAADAGDERLAPSATAAELGRSPNINIDVQRDNGSRGATGQASQNVAIRVRLRNREPKANFERLTHHVYAVARHSLYDNSYRLLIKETDPVSLPAGGAYEYLTKSVPIAASTEEQPGNFFAYYGWLLVLKDHNGDVLLTKGSQSKLLNNSAAVGAVAEGSEFSL